MRFSLTNSHLKWRNKNKVMSATKADIANITLENFDEVINQQEQPVLVDFWAPWCPPCKAFGPVIQEFANEHPEAVVAKLNIVDSPELAQRFGIRSIPAILVFKNGEVVSQTSGVVSKSELTAQLGLALR